MRSILALLLLFVFCLGATADDSPANKSQPHDAKTKEVERELRTFAGTWEIARVEPAGSTKDAKYLVFRKDQTYAALDANHQELWAGIFDLDPTATPKIWDHRSNETKKTGGDVLGIYELDGDKLKVSCVAGVWKEKQWTGKPRPTKFELPAADVVLELRRVKPRD